MKVLFLDIDGVLNSDAYFLGIKDTRTECLDSDFLHLDPSKIALLNNIVTATQAEAALHRRGATFEFFGATPELTEERRRERFGIAWQGNYTPRGLEIQCWLDEHPQVTRFAIVDDEPDMEHLVDHLVLTDPRLGLTEQDCARILKLLADRSA